MGRPAGEVTDGNTAPAQRRLSRAGRRIPTSAFRLALAPAPPCCFLL